MIDIEVKMLNGDFYNFDVKIDSFEKLIKEINKCDSGAFIRFGKYAFNKSRIEQIKLVGE